MTEDDAILSAFCESGAFVPVQSESAYHAFVSGKMLADISPQAELLVDFYDKNKAEFVGTTISRHEDGRFPHVERLGRKIWITWHQHKVAKNLMKEFQAIIIDNPSLQC